LRTPIPNDGTGWATSYGERVSEVRHRHSQMLEHVLHDLAVGCSYPTLVWVWRYEGERKGSG